MVGLGLAQMSALLSSQAMMKHTSDLSRNRNLMKGEMGVLECEIKTDKGRGLDPKGKEERLSDIENSSNNLMGQIAENTDKLNDKIADDNEKISKEKADEKAKEAKVTEKATEASAPKAAESVTSSSDGTVAAGSTSARTVDTVEISEFGQKMAASAPQVVSVTPLPQPTPVGEVVNIKV